MMPGLLCSHTSSTAHDEGVSLSSSIRVFIIIIIFFLEASFLQSP